ncbi:hypothetical protein IX317_002234 [Fusobacterium sp. DD29]|uniref:hypothetical protein n=1 Tax=unclassified Fusobacterium TaxID=2648384 RepID=UPI001B8AB87C|nr:MULTISPECIES: hypothetical protein [unclassified Fusobacterium]MBR8702307.1 hypothetical protein [Fusobacterium sp. DD45]MBR8712124.1 hypothetical protein [Fusobacterium sp. DD28]MBR8750512.1 hypothetical protein [Fusobacterium sp. DD29]MBR8752703.1 hypothetical protein [Fusobacterium sp. DD26]MBR8762758.1 hypothetical protein [Fusobacterium sp. DD25]
MHDSYLDTANRLESILRKYLDCHYSDFGIKANNNLLKYDWKSPINFALGVLYERNRDLKHDIDSFLGNELYEGQSIEEVVANYPTPEEGLARVNEIIDLFEALLKKGN